MSMYATALWATVCFTAAAAAAAGCARARASTLRVKYLAVYALMVGGDWAQGAYVYALYERYGFRREEIALLFVAGFAASMVGGTVVGALADRRGRKALGVGYAVVYVGSCLTKHSDRLEWLVAGRILGGVATSLLMSVFEAWLVCEYGKDEGREAQDSLKETLAMAAGVNSVVAILCGLLAQMAADALPMKRIGSEGSHWFWGGYTAPFDLAVIFLLLGAVVLVLTWEENYGDEEDGSNFVDRFVKAMQVIKRDRTVLLVGLVQSLFEGAMYSFVFMWTPALSSENASPPFGIIFSTFMVSCMFGSQLFEILIRRGFEPHDILATIFLVATFALGVGPAQHVLGWEGESKAPKFVGFLVFEVCTGMYFPCMGLLKSRVVEETYRASIYNLFRVPLNAIVLLVLLANLSVNATFSLCSGLLFAAFFLQQVLSARLNRIGHLPLPASPPRPTSLLPLETPLL